MTKYVRSTSRVNPQNTLLFVCLRQGPTGLNLATMWILVESRDQTEIVSLDGRCLYPLATLAHHWEPGVCLCLPSMGVRSTEQNTWCFYVGFGNQNWVFMFVQNLSRLSHVSFVTWNIFSIMCVCVYVWERVHMCWNELTTMCVKIRGHWESALSFYCRSRTHPTIAQSFPRTCEHASWSWDSQRGPVVGELPSI